MSVPLGRSQQGPPNPHAAQGPHPHGHLDSYDHDHGHSGGQFNRLRYALAGLFGSHSHNVVDQIDDALEADARGRRALWISLAILVLTAAVQAAVVVVSGSVALLGDTLHNVADALTAVPLLVAFAIVRRPSDDRFTYGYGRAEDLAGLFVVAMIALSTVIAGYEATRRLLHPQPVTALGAVAAAAVVGFLGNEAVAVYRIRVGRAIGSAALVSDGLHARADGLTSLAVLLGVGGLAVGWDWADGVVGLLITVALVGVLRSAWKQIAGRLMDAVEPALVQSVRASLASTPGVRSVSMLRLRWVGHDLFAEARVTVDPGSSMASAHDVARTAEDDLHAALPRLAAVTVQVCPSSPLAGEHRCSDGHHPPVR